MGIIAVAGGTGSIGRTIIKALIEHGTHEVIVLSRRAPTDGETFRILQVNYTDIETTASTFEVANIDIIICAFGMVSDASSETQIKLIHAANRSKCTRRFVISEFDMLFEEEHIPYIPTEKWAFDALRVIKNTDLEHTRVVNGMFLDYYGLPHWNGHLKPWVNAVNVMQKWAVIPGDGEALVSFITTQDLGRFIARLMDQELWPQISCFAGVTASFNEILRIAEDARGEKFSVAYEDLETLQTGKISFPEFEDAGFEGSGRSNEAIFALFHRVAATGGYCVPADKALDGKFSDIKVTSAKEVMENQITAVQSHINSNPNNALHATISLTPSSNPLSPSSMRVKPQLVSLTSNNLSYARGGWALHWWDTYPVPLDSPAPYNDQSAWGIRQIHPLGSNAGLPWTPEDADTSSAVVIALAASTKTARLFTYNLARRSTGVPLGYLLVSSSPEPLISATAKAAFPVHAVPYSELEKTAGWLADRKPKKLVFIDFGGRDDGLDQLCRLIERTESLKDSKRIIIQVGSPQKVYTGEELQASRDAMVAKGKIQYNTSEVQDTLRQGDNPEAYLNTVSKGWDQWLDDRAIAIPDMRLVGAKELMGRMEYTEAGRGCVKET